MLGPRISAEEIELPADEFQKHHGAIFNHGELEPIRIGELVSLCIHFPVVGVSFILDLLTRDPSDRDPGGKSREVRLQDEPGLRGDLFELGVVGIGIVSGMVATQNVFRIGETVVAEGIENSRQRLLARHPQGGRVHRFHFDRLPIDQPDTGEEGLGASRGGGAVLRGIAVRFSLFEQDTRAPVTS